MASANCNNCLVPCFPLIEEPCQCLRAAGKTMNAHVIFEPLNQCNPLGKADKNPLQKDRKEVGIDALPMW